MKCHQCGIETREFYSSIDDPKMLCKECNTQRNLDKLRNVKKNDNKS